MILLFSRSTILVRLDTQNNESLAYAAGDHLAIYPSNRAELVDALISKLQEAPDPDQPMTIEISSEREGKDPT